MAEHSFQEVMRQFDRMCKANAGCSGCPLHKRDGVSDGCSIGAFVNDSGRIEREIMSWAAEHPEPVYPTWYEFLKTNAWEWMRENCRDWPRDDKTWHRFINEARIPADIAEKLGIEPKEE